MLADNGCLNVNPPAPDVKTGGRSLPFCNAVVEALGSVLALAADDFDGDVSKAVHAERARARGREIDDAPADKRPTIIDTHHDRTAGLMIGDPHLGPERQALMRSRQTRRACIFPVGTAFARIN